MSLSFPFRSILLFALFALLPSTSLFSQSLADESEEHEGERVADRYWNPLFTAERYRDALEHVRRMPDETSERKGASLMRTTAWEGIGPSWVRITPTIGWHGRMRAIRWYRDPSTGRLETILGASSGGLWFGNFAVLLRVWSSIGDNLPNPSIGAFLVDSVNVNTIWAGTGDWARYGGAGLYKTTNRGAVWDEVRLDAGIRPNAITGLEYGTSRSTMYMSTSSGFFRSLDSGVTWRQRSFGGFFYPIYDMAVDPTNRSILYAAAANKDGIFKSTNSGDTWSRITSGIVLGRIGPTTAIAISPSSPNILYAAASDTSGNTGVIYRTTDAGATWQPTGTPVEYIFGGQAFHAHAINVSPADPNRVYVGSVGFIRSTDGGATWEGRDAGHPDITAIEFLPGDPGYVYVLSDGGLFIHRDATGQVSNNTEVFTPSAPIQAYALEDAWSNSKMMVSGTQDNGTLMTLRAGDRDQLWSSIGGCDGGNTIAIHPTDPTTIYFNSWCGPSNPRLRSSDQGATNKDISQGLPEIYYTPLRLNKASTNNPFTVTRTHLYYSTNEGADWRRATTAPGMDFDTNRQAVRNMTVSFQADGPVAAYTWYWDGRGTSGRTLTITRGTPGAMISVERAMPGNEIINQVVVDRWSATTAYVMTNGPASKIYRTTDQGDTWQNITGNLPDANSWDLVARPSSTRQMYVANDMGVFRTVNDGASWTRFQNGLPIVGANSFSYIRGTGFDTLRVATFGRGYWHRVLDGGDPIAIQIDRSRLGSISLRDVAVIRPGSIPAYQIPDTIITVGADGFIGVSVNSGQSFDVTKVPTNVLMRGVAASDCTHVTAVGDAGTIIHSTTTAREWQIVASGVSVPLRGIAFVGDTGWTYGDDGVILRSTNKGGAWERVNDEKGTSWNTASFTDAQNGWIAGSDIGPNQQTVPVLSRTTDGGASWTLWQTPPAVFTSMQFLDPTNAYATGDGGILYRSTNGGSNWTGLTTGFKTLLTDLEALSPDEVYMTTNDGRIIRTVDGGKTFDALEDIQAPGAFHAIVRMSEQLIAVGDTAIAFVRFRGEAPPDTVAKPPFIINFAAGVEAPDAPSAVAITSVAPNPAAGETTIRFTLRTRGDVVITLHSLLGEPVATLRNGALAAGAHSAVWNLTDDAGHPVPAGTYLVRITSSSGAASARVTVVR